MSTREESIKGNPRASASPGTANAGVSRCSSYRSSSISTGKQGHKSIAVCLPSGSQVGKLVREDSGLVWERRIKTKHILRFLDALTLNDGLLRAIRGEDVILIRYRLRNVGVYEITLGRFLEKCSLLQGFANGEDVYAVPRGEWRFTPASARHLKLFSAEQSDRSRN